MFLLNLGLEDFVFQWVWEMEDLWNVGEGEWWKFMIYVNYVVGYELLEFMYGYELWWLEKLCVFKVQYDFLNKFVYYNFIVLLESQVDGGMVQIGSRSLFWGWNIGKSLVLFFFKCVLFYENYCGFNVNLL